MASTGSERPARHGLSVVQATAMLVGIVVGIGIFKTPSIVAANSPSEGAFLALWLLGGVLTLAGALCYAELSSAYPDAGGEYLYLRKAYGDGVGFLFAWGRMAVIQTGAIAAVAFVYGDYVNLLVPLGSWGPALHAGVAVAALTGMQLLGTTLSARTQLVLEILTVATVLAVAVAGFVAGENPSPPPPATAQTGAVGLAMVFVLLTYGGWNEAAYLSGEVRDARRNMVRVLVAGTLIVIALYMLMNVALLSAFGLEGLRQTQTPAADMAARAFGPVGALVIGAAVILAAITTLNVTIFTGARTNLSLGANFPPFALMGGRDEATGAPRTALLVQAGIALALIGLGSQERDGFTSMVEYTAPVFWSFLLLIGIALFLFRMREPSLERPFRVPLYPLTPAIFCATGAYLLYSSLAYTGYGALFGVAVLLAGVPIYLWGRKRPETPATGLESRSRP